MLGSENWDLVEAIDNAEEKLKQYPGKVFVSSFIIEDKKTKMTLTDVQHNFVYYDFISDANKSVISILMRAIANEVHQHNETREVDDKITGNESPTSEISYYPLKLTKRISVMKVVFRVKGESDIATSSSNNNDDENPSNE